MKHAILVEYKGGGYSGCFWEWNYFAVINGEFHNILSTGSAGVKDYEDAKRLLHDNAEPQTVNQYLYDNRRDAYIYDLNIQASINDFTANSNPGNIIGVLRYLTEHDLTDFRVLCPRCNRPHDPDEYMLDPNNYKGDGGIGIEWREFHCQDCQDEHTCPECGDYMSRDDEKDLGKYDECPNCKPGAVSEDDYTDKERQHITELETEINWLNKTYLQWPADFDRTGKITELTAELADFETDIAYRHDDRYTDRDNSLEGMLWEPKETTDTGASVTPCPN